MKLQPDAKQKPVERCDYCARPVNDRPDDFFLQNMAGSATICCECVKWFSQVVEDAHTLAARGEPVALQQAVEGAR